MLPWSLKVERYRMLRACQAMACQPTRHPDEPESMPSQGFLNMPS